MTAYLQQKYQVILEANNYNTYVHLYRISSNIILECDHEFYQVILVAKNYNTYVHGYRISSNIILECDHEFYYLNQIQFPAK